MLLCDGFCTEDIVFKFLLGLSGIHNDECQKEHSLILRLEFLKECLGIFSEGRKVRGDYVHVVSCSDRFLLLLYLASVKFRNGMLYPFDRIVLIYRLKMHRNDLA